MSVRAPFLFWPGAPLHKQLRVADLSGKGGLTSRFNVRGTLTAHDTVEGEDFATTQDLSNTNVDITASSKQVITWITDEAMSAVTDPYDAQMLMRQEAEEHVRAHAQKLDVAVLTLATSLTQGAADTGNDMTIGDIVTALGIMDAANVATPRAGIISPVQWNDLVKESSSALASAAVSGQVGASLWGNYKVESFLGIDWFVSSNVYNDGTDAYGAILSPRAIGLVWKKAPEITLEYDQSRRAYEISSVAMWGVGVVEATQGYFLKFGKS